MIFFYNGNNYIGIMTKRQRKYNQTKIIHFAKSIPAVEPKKFNAPITNMPLSLPIALDLLPSGNIGIMTKRVYFQ